MTIPCIEKDCQVYNKNNNKCGVLVVLQAPLSEVLGLQAPLLEGRPACLDQLLSQRPCQFSKYIMKMARHFIYKRGLSSRIDPADVHNDVVVALMKMGFHRVNPTYEDFRRLVTTMTRNAVHQGYVQLYGDYCCGTCVFFREKSKGMPSRCGNANIQPPSDQQYIQVNYSTNPKDVAHGSVSLVRGCTHYTPTQFTDPEGITLSTELESSEVEETLKYMESLGPRQRSQAHLIRLKLDGYDEVEIVEQTGKHRSTISKDLNGTNEAEGDGTGNEIDYHQAGAREVFLAIYTGAVFILKEKETDLWQVVNRRDFSADEKRPAFDKISGGLDITKRQAIERYIAGWNWINKEGEKGDETMSRSEEDKRDEKPEPLRPMRRISRVSEMQHPDFHALLCYAEDALDQEARGRVAVHILICESCLAELEHIEMDVVPEMNRPISMSERLNWMAARLVGRLRGARESELVGQVRVWLPAVTRSKRGNAADFQNLTVQGADEKYRFLTVLDEDEAGELYLFMSISSERKGAVYCWPVDGAQAQLPFIPDEAERHRYQAYLTDREFPVPEGVRLDLKINDEERNEERRRLVAAFLEALERGEITYRAAEQGGRQ